jgi:outer membrane biosynthesis protein TonB
MACPMITPQKNELQKLQKLVSTSAAGLLLPLLVCSLVFLPSSYSNAGDGVNSNTILDGSSTTSTSSGTPTSVTVTNDDNSTTTTQTTPITTTTTTYDVNQTEVPNVVTNPTFSINGGGASTGWSISTCPGGCAFSPSNGFMAGNGGTITQSYTQDDLFPDAINSTEEAQGMTFSFGAEVDNNQVGSGNRADTWSIKLELFDSDDSSLGSTEIGSTVIFAPTIKTGTVDIDSGNVVNSGVLTIFGDTALNGDYRYGPFFTDVFTTFTYNEIEETISTALTYDTLITQVTCEVLETCILVDTSAADVALSVVSETSREVEVSAVAEVAEVAEIAALPTVTATAETTMQVAAIEAPAEPSVAEAPVNEEVASAAQPDLSEPESEPAPASSTSNKPESKVSATKKATPKQKAVAKKKSMSKAGNKIVKKMGSKKYSSQNQVKTLVLMQVLGNTSTFFDPGKIIPDTPNFFAPTTLPDNSISDNNLAAYALIGGSDATMDSLVNSQYGGK